MFTCALALLRFAGRKVPRLSAVNEFKKRRLELFSREKSLLLTRTHPRSVHPTIQIGAPPGYRVLRTSKGFFTSSPENLFGFCHFWNGWHYFATCWLFKEAQAT